MKTKLVIINWLFAWLPLSYNGESPAIAAIVVGYFGFASWLLTKHQKAVDKELRHFEKQIDRIINN